jgi:hypothetical protein
MGVVIKVGGVGMRTGIVSLPIASGGDIPATDADITAFSELIGGKFAAAASHFELDWQSGPSLPLSRIAERIGAQLRAPVEIEVLSHLPSMSDDK